jgi:hypothetical protein
MGMHVDGPSLVITYIQIWYMDLRLGVSRGGRGLRFGSVYM